MPILLIKDGTRIVLDVTDVDIDMSLHTLRPGGPLELVLTMFSGGAHCCTTSLIYTQDHGTFENIGMLDQGDFPAGYQELNHDGTEEILTYSNNLAYYDWSFASSPAINGVLGWDGQRLADRTRAYAYVPVQAAARYLKELQKELADPADTLEESLEILNSQVTLPT